MTLVELNNLLEDAPLEVVADVEHLPDVAPGLAHLLGVALCWPGSEGFYIPINHWVGVPSTQLESVCEPSCIDRLRSFLSERQLMGWNIEHDREWIDACFGITSNWTIDGRVFWYLTDQEQTERGYGLKRAQIKLLQWEEQGDSVLKAEVESSGGRLSNGDHYRASIATLGNYARLDAFSTSDIIEFLRRRNGYSDIISHLAINIQYARLLAKATRSGVAVDEFALRKAQQDLKTLVAESEQRLLRVCSEPIKLLEASLLNKRVQGYKTESGKSAFLAAPARHPRFNPRSADHRSMLLHDIIGLPVVGHTETGKPKSDKNSIATMNHPSARVFVELSKNQKLLQFCNQYIEHSDNGIIHFPHDTTATVSERLGGYAPYDLNMPFSCEPIMRAFRTRPGYIGIHMDLVSIEPCLIAGFSGDPTMVKVYRDGLGDIYLDLCIDIFPLEEAGDYEAHIHRLITEFHRDYKSGSPPDSGQKDRFGLIRKSAKIIQLAVGYTGTKYTVAKHLTQAGFPTSLAKADLMVERYWQRFQKVASLAGKLSDIAQRKGYITGFYGRRLYIPKKQAKDALNRFGQHGGHAILREIVFGIDSRAEEVGMRPLLPDIHDSTSWEVPEANYEVGVGIFNAAIERVNRDLDLPVRVRGEIKSFKTFFGLKHKEE